MIERSKAKANTMLPSRRDRFFIWFHMRYWNREIKKASRQGFSALHRWRRFILSPKVREGVKDELRKHGYTVRHDGATHMWWIDWMES